MAKEIKFVRNSVPLLQRMHASLVNSLLGNMKQPFIMDLSIRQLRSIFEQPSMYLYMTVRIKHCMWLRAWATAVAYSIPPS